MALTCRMTWAWSETVELCNREMILTRKICIYHIIFGPRQFVPASAPLPPTRHDDNAAGPEIDHTPPTRDEII